MENTEVKGTQQANTQPEGNGSQAEKTFTQEEVNRIVSDRLSREKAKAEPTEESKKLMDLTARENKIACKEYITEKGYPEKLCEIFDTSDKTAFATNCEKLIVAFPEIVEPINHAVVGRTNNSSHRPDDKLAAIFKTKL